MSLVELEIGDFRIVQNVVAMLVGADFVAQFFDLFFRTLCHAVPLSLVGDQRNIARRNYTAKSCPDSRSGSEPM